MITVTAEGESAVIRADGLLDEAGGEALLMTARRLARAGLHRVELDLSGITSADLSGVRALDDARGTLEKSGAQLTIYNANVASYPTDWHSIPLTDLSGHRKARSDGQK